jgi:chromosome segregation ATPase
MRDEGGLARLEVALVLILGVAFAVSVAMMVRESRQLADGRRQRTADLQALRELQEALRHRELPKAPVVVESRTPAGENRAGLAERDATIERLNHELSEAQANITQLQGQLATSTDERARALAATTERFQNEQEDWQNRLDTLQQQLDSAEAELQASRQRLANLEAANAKLQSASSDSSARAAELGRVVASLQDVDHRRDAYLSSIIHRYRDITAQFRAMSGMLDSSRDPNSNVFTGATLTRIQNAISQADDDLRQLTELNARARELQAKLVKK